jgi:hypothetical protein
MPVEVKVLTPEVTRKLNEDGVPYVYYGFESADYLTFASWHQDVLRYLRQVQEVLAYYRKDLEEKE